MVRKSNQLAPVPPHNSIPNLPNSNVKTKQQKVGCFSRIYHQLLTRNPRSVESLSWIVFVILFTLVATAGQGNDGSSYALANDIRTLLSNFMGLGKASDWWGFMTDTFLPLLYATTWYNGDPLQASDVGLTNFEYVIVGKIGIRQLRVRNDSCKVRYTFNGTNPGCYADFSSSAEDQRPYGPIDNSTGLPMYRYSTAKQLGCTTACYSSGLYAVYPTSGFFEQLPPATGSNTSLNNATEQIAELMAGRWIDRQTRAVFAEFAVYSVATNLIAPISLSLEFPAAGGAIPFIAVNTIRAENLFPTAASSAGPLAAEALLFLLLVAYTAQAAREWRAAGTSSYWSSAWAAVDWLNFLLLYATYGVRLAAFANASKIRFPPGPNEAASFAQVGSLVELWKNLLGANSVGRR